VSSEGSFSHPTSAEAPSASAPNEIARDELAEFDMLMAMASQEVSSRRGQDLHHHAGSVGSTVSTQVAHVSSGNVYSHRESAAPLERRTISEPVRRSEGNISTQGQHPQQKQGDTEAVTMDDSWDYEAILKMEAAALAARGKPTASTALSGANKTERHETKMPQGEDRFTCHRFIALDVMDVRDERQRRVKHVLCYPAQSPMRIDSDEIESTITSVLLYDDW
jgi:hypothetical protein